MAIASMKKVVLVAPKSYQEVLLQAVQELQNLELTKSIAQEELAVFVQEREFDTQKEKQQLFEEVSANIDFLEKYQPKLSFIAQHKQPKTSYALLELIEKVNTFDKEELLHQVRRYQDDLIHFEQEKQDLDEKEQLLRRWSNLAFVPNQLANHYVMTQLGVIPQTNDNSYRTVLENSEHLVISELYHTKEEIGVAVSYATKDESYAHEELAKARFTVFKYPFERTVAEELSSVLQRKQQVLRDEKELRELIKKDVALTEQLKLWSEVLYNDLQREESGKLLLNTTHVFVMQGYLKANEYTLVEQQLAEYVPSGEYAFLEQEIAEEEYETVPTVLENHPLVAPFETITEMYGLPKYGQLDPTPFTMPFYMAFFGMMSADIGYGLILWAATGALLKFLHLDKGMKKNIQFFHLLSYPTIAWGIIFGSFFGVDMPFQLLSLTNDLTTIMAMSVIFGVIQILLGLGLGAYTNIRNKQYKDAYLSNIGWLAILLGLVLYIVGAVLVQVPAVAFIGQWMAIIAAIGIVVVSILTSANKLAGLAGGLYNLYGISGYVGDIVSYTRLMALAVSGGSIAAAFNTLVGFLPPVAKFTVGILMIVLLHALNIFLTFLGSYVHGLRLQFVEYYAKFYEGGGRKFAPLKTYEKYIEVKQKTVKK